VECLTHTVLVECDEDQHRDYACENKRMMQLFQDLGSRPLVVIRFNPDAYAIEGGRIEGCFKHTQSGSWRVQRKEWKKRIKRLVKVMTRHLSTVPTKELTIEHLFYDQPGPA
jgi:hypothetical protein